MNSKKIKTENKMEFVQGPTIGSFPDIQRELHHVGDICGTECTV